MSVSVRVLIVLMVVAFILVTFAVILHLLGLRHSYPSPSPAPMVTDVQLVTE